ncbi:uncharacterized protein LOC123675663 [Harmonia axyridis]|uniref:uncharacterized protein LOC123675663 n=1 Tax=Harmonia axyridis TaxID=115357 RepID=UPI001E276F47|nr:uncharacterized protein LOC123675663 [Harmonia axyridis]
MDSSTFNCNLFEKFNIQNTQYFRRNVALSTVPDDWELMGFKNTQMVFKKRTFNRSFKNISSTALKKGVLHHSKTDLKNLNIYKTTRKIKNSTTCESSNHFVIDSIKHVTDTEKKDMSQAKLIFDPNGKKFIYLNGQKLQIIKHSPGKVEDNVVDTEYKSVPNILNLKSINFNTAGSKIEPDQSKCQSSKLNIKDPQQIKVHTIKHVRTILPKYSDKVVSIKKNQFSPNISLITKEVGGESKLVNSPNTSILGIPLIQDIAPSSNAPDKLQTLKVKNISQMTTTHCIKKTHESVSVSTNTEHPNTVHIGVQTEDIIENEPLKETRVENCLSELYSGGVIIGDDVNMGHGPPSIYSLNTEKLKMKFFNDIHQCLKWDSGNLPIHRAVIQKNLKEVKSQCIVLKARKAGVNIANINDYTPLQLAVVQSVGTDIVEVLLKYDADMSVLDSEGNNVLHLAVEHNRNDLVQIFLEKLNADNLDIDQFNYDGLTPLMMCAFHNDRIDMAEQFLKKNAQMNLKDLKSGRTAIFHAAESHNASMVSLLLDYGADTKIRNFFGTSVHDAMFELDDMPKEIKYPILGRDLKVHEKRKLYQQNVRRETFKRKKLDFVSTIQKLKSRSNFVMRDNDIKK